MTNLLFIEQLVQRSVIQRQELMTMLKPETVEMIAQEWGIDGIAVAHHWATQWGRQVRAMEAAGTLLPAIEEEAPKWQAARLMEQETPWMGGIETKQLSGIDLTRPPTQT